MIRVLPAILLSLAACQPVQGGLTAAERQEILRIVPGADLSALTPEQTAALSDALRHGDGFDTAYELRSILMR